MEPFPEKDEFEIGQPELIIQIFELCDLFVFFKRGIPFLLIHRRQSPHDRLPFSDRQPGAGDPRDATQQYLDHDHHNTQ